jgi:hypothetical protein
MFWLNRPSSDVQVVVMKESADHRNAEQQIPSSQKPLRLMMAGWAETCSDIQ